MSSFRNYTRTGALLIAALAGGAAPGSGQRSPDSAKAPKEPKYTSSRFWESADLMDLTLVVNVRQLQRDKADRAPWRMATIRSSQDNAVSIPVRVRTRGRSRLKMCDRFPPIWVDFAKAKVKGTTFQHLNRFKLVSPCKHASDYDRHVLQEYNVYRLHALFTPVSHRTRLLRLTVIDSASRKPAFTRFAFAVEDIDELALRVGGNKVEALGLIASDFQPRQLALMGMLQYMIGNTDFSFSAKHNAEFVKMNDTFYPIIYDYDGSGVVNAPYAVPDPRLGILKVTDRLYRGLCVEPDTVLSVIAELQARRPEVEALYKDTVGTLMGGNATGWALRYLGQFYIDVENQKTVKNEILGKCAEAR
jgi:hypothetical protein